MTGWSRRAVLAAAAGVAALALPARAGGLRVATVDWAVMETLFALGVVPVAGTELRQFRQVAVEPAVPPDITDLGLRGMINLEVLRLARPDLIYSSSFYGALEPRLRRIAPVESFAIFVPGGEPFARSEAMTLAVGRRLGIEAAAETLVARVNDRLAAGRERLSAGDGRPVIPINLGDARHFRVFGGDSMFGATLARLGLTNAWTEATDYSAMAPLGLERLAQVPEAWIVLIPPVPPDTPRLLTESTFWNALPNVRAGRVLRLEPVNPFGALPSAERFGRLLVEAMLSAPGGGANG